MNIEEAQVSVIIPTYNRGKLIASCVESVLNQTYTNYELIIVDDASPDGSAAAISSLYPETLYPKIRLISLAENCGPAGARNAGLRLASGQFVAFLDHDDSWEPSYLEKQIKALSENQQCVLSFCNVVESDEENSYRYCSFKPWQTYPKITHQVLLTEDIISTMSIVVVRQEALAQVGLLNEELRICHDKELYLRLLCLGGMVHLPEILVTRYIHSNNLSRRQVQLLVEEDQRTIDLFFSADYSTPYRIYEAEARSYAILRKARLFRWLFQDDCLALKLLIEAFFLSPSYVLKEVVVSLKKRCQKGFSKVIHTPS